ncbi:hypothetical protein K457DRAFT_565351 [Linnemannia elongata AG-77]|uniref:Uncharacterized protein n=1 Tax=Linnemannia elongata AG-77 TaxID=1314771 RepID=A0A197JSQ9_9FUNG|nr:hypothetical protein K457DRAFT_565351 [Linnemannia elongata AG-77]
MLLIKTVALLCSATATMAATAVVSGAIFVGKDTTEYNDSPVDIFRNPENHAAAAASILVYSANSANFHPASQEPKALGQNLIQFVTKASTFPGFLSTTIRDDILALNGSLTQFEKVIREKLNDPLVARAFRDLVPGYINDHSLTEWDLSLVVVTKPENSNTVTVKFTARLIVSDHQVLANVLIVNAERFATSFPVYKVRDFIDFFASPKVPLESKETQHGSTSCTKNQPIFKDRQTVMSWFL